MAKGPDRRTDKEKRRTMVRTRTSMHKSALELVTALHNEGFSNLWLESNQITADGQYYIKVIVNDGELNHNRMSLVTKVAEVHGAKVMLDELYLNGQRISRIALWPTHH